MTWTLDLALIASTFAVIFFAELPDKSFIATLVLATRYPRLWVWLGATAAFGLQMLIAVAAGQVLSLLPRVLVLGATAVLFIIGSVVLVRGGLKARDQELAEESATTADVAAHAPPVKGWAAVGTTFAIIFTAEWGDLTQLVTAGQAARTGMGLSVFLGSWLALAAVTGIAVLVGSWLAGRVPLWRIRIVSGVLLAVLALVTLVELLHG